MVLLYLGATTWNNGMGGMDYYYWTHLLGTACIGGCSPRVISHGSPFLVSFLKLITDKIGSHPRLGQLICQLEICGAMHQPDQGLCVYNLPDKM